MTNRIATVIAARTTIGGVLLGVPAVLVLLAGNPLPSGAEWTAMLRLEPDWGNTVLLGTVLPCLAWIAWALFAYPLLAELLRHRTGRSVLPTAAFLRGQQQIAAALVATALLSSSPALGASTRAPVSRTERIITTDDVQEQIDLRAVHAQAATPRLTLAAHIAPSADPTLSTYEVRRGDTLWGIAERRLGDGRDYPAIVDHSTQIVQPDGRHLTDPNLIVPGWHLEIPTSHTATPPEASAAPVPHPPTATATPAPRAVPPVTPAPQSPTTQTGNGGENVETARDGEGTAVAIGGGVASILAAGLIAALTDRRRRQRARRRFGERLPVPSDGAAADTETQLRAVSDPDALTSLHRALAAILGAARSQSTPLPSLFAVRVDDTDITLYLHEAASLPSPFRPLFTDETGWTAPRDAFTQQVEPFAVAPYPALVTVGTDLGGGLLLLDLEQQSHLTVYSSDRTTAQAALNAIAGELASVPWGEDIHLSLVGVPGHLALELDPYRIHRVGDAGTLIRDIRAHLADRRGVLDAAGIPDARAARLQHADGESWAPFVVLIGSPPTPDEQTQLDDLLRQHASTGLVIVSVDDQTSGRPAGAVVITDSSAATYQSNDPTVPRLPFIPQLLSQPALEHVLQLFAQTATVAAPVSSQPASPPVSRDERSAEVPKPRAEQLGLRSEIPEESPYPDTTSRNALAGLDERHDVASTSWGVAPYLHLLGQVEIRHVNRAELVPGRGVELLTYLLHHRRPLAGAQIHKALWPSSYDRTNGNLRSLAKQVRAALGHDPDGHLWLPEGRGNAGFTTHPALRSDWQDFLDLIGPDPRATSTGQLAAALRLVHGQPLLGTDGHRGRWAWRAPLEEAIISTVQDVAAVVADRAMAEGDRTLTKLAIRAARFADMFSELSWQIELRAAIPRGVAADVDRIVADLFATAGHGNPDYEPDDETISLIRDAKAPTGDAQS